ncbi:MAG: pantoate--beta-alanine ligase [Natronospirillum sp.]|uniref:pantoate--beta-alanine ligase n=1 Tax=Natronospirillum sp. TaxID=2812955 RepID=UPI0025F13110|nr:pantoate--beta-alanine ligase [Natronospirillum sp.]MCH8553238.1 pantoate--beta-alanine ligase [Natronospirillum sp.]
MQIYTKPEELRRLRHELTLAGKTLAVVPTMGNLHDGHLSLIEKAQSLADLVICTIFVNPSQFGPEEDLDAYPRTPDADLTALRRYHVDGVFTPGVEGMYPPGDETRVTVPALSERHCGAVRPGHFTGVATVVCKFLNMIQADFAVFGEKDFQQLAIIKRMVTDLFIPTEIHGAPTLRADDGLALSSRNAYLTGDERQRAPDLYRQLVLARDRILQGERDFEGLELSAQDALVRSGWRPDYFSVCSQQTLQPASATDTDLVILAAARLGQARLIDNLTLNLKG